MRAELLNGELFQTLHEARVVITHWASSYNNFPPAPKPGHDDPAAFAASYERG